MIIKTIEDLATKFNVVKRDFGKFQNTQLFDVFISIDCDCLENWSVDTIQKEDLIDICNYLLNPKKYKKMENHCVIYNLKTALNLAKKLDSFVDFKIKFSLTLI